MLPWLLAGLLLAQITGGTVPAGRLPPSSSPTVVRPRPPRATRPIWWGGPGYYGGSTEVVIVERATAEDRAPLVAISPAYQPDRPRPELKEYANLPPGRGLPLAAYLLAFRLL